MRFRTLAATAVCLGLVTAGSGGLSRRIVAWQVSAALSALPGVSVGGVEREAGDIVLTDVAYRGRGIALHIGRMRWPAPPSPWTLIGEAQAAPGGIAASDLSITYGKVVVTASQLEALGTTLTLDRLKALLDPGSAIDGTERLKALTAAAITTPLVTLTSAASPDDTEGGRATIENVALIDVVAGRIGAVRVGKTVLFRSDAPDAARVATIGSTSATGLDLPLALAIAKTARADRAAAPRPIVQSLALRDLTVTPDDTGSLAIGALTSGALSGRPFLAQPDALARLLDKPEADKTPDERRALADAALDASQGFALDRLEWTDVALTVRKPDATFVKVGRLAIDGIKPTQLGTWTADDLALGTSDASFTLAHLALRAPDEAGAVAALARAYPNQDTEAMGATSAAAAAVDGSLTLLGLHLDVPAKDHPGNSPDGGRRDLVDVPLFSIASETDPTSKVVTGSAHARLSYGVPRASDNPGFATLLEHGIATIDTGADYRMVVDRAGKTLQLDPVSVTVAKLGHVAMSLDLGNVPYDHLYALGSDETPTAADRQTTIRGLSFDLVDDGAAAIALPALAANANTSVALLKAGAKTQVDLAIGQALGGTPAGTRLANAIDAFIEEPHSLHVALVAPQGVSLADIQDAADPKALLDRVGIEAYANR